MRYDDALREIGNVWGGRPEGVACSTILRYLAAMPVVPDSLDIREVQAVARSAIALTDEELASALQFLLGHSVPVFCARFFYPIDAALRHEVTWADIQKAQDRGVYHDPETGDAVAYFEEKVEVRLGIRGDAKAMFEGRA